MGLSGDLWGPKSLILEVVQRQGPFFVLIFGLSNLGVSSRSSLHILWFRLYISSVWLGLKD